MKNWWRWHGVRSHGNNFISFFVQNKGYNHPTSQGVSYYDDFEYQIELFCIHLEVKWSIWIEVSYTNVHEPSVPPPPIPHALTQLCCILWFPIHTCSNDKMFVKIDISLMTLQTYKTNFPGMMILFRVENTLHYLVGKE